MELDVWCNSRNFRACFVHHPSRADPLTFKNYFFSVECISRKEEENLLVMSSIFVMDIRVSLSFIRPFNNRNFICVTIANHMLAHLFLFLLLTSYICSTNLHSDMKIFLPSFHKCLERTLTIGNNSGTKSGSCKS